MSKFKITEHQAGHVIILEVEGAILIGEGSVELRHTIQRLVAEGKKNLLASLGKVRFIDSAGLGELVSAFVMVRRAGGQLKLTKVAEGVQDLLALTKIVTVFEIYEDELDALNSFPLSDDYKLVPYDGGINWDNADEDERLYRWTKIDALNDAVAAAAEKRAGDPDGGPDAQAREGNESATPPARTKAQGGGSADP